VYLEHGCAYIASAFAYRAKSYDHPSEYSVCHCVRRAMRL
jgi:hypothetical protein